MNCASWLIRGDSYAYQTYKEDSEKVYGVSLGYSVFKNDNTSRIRLHLLRYMASYSQESSCRHFMLTKTLTLYYYTKKMHIRRADNLWRVLVLLIVSAHWFNPLCWVFLRLFLTDIELSCDECVLLKLGDNHSKEYALSLLESKQSANVFIIT